MRKGDCCMYCDHCDYFEDEFGDGDWDTSGYYCEKGHHIEDPTQSVCEDFTEG